MEETLFLKSGLRRQGFLIKKFLAEFICFMPIWSIKDADITLFDDEFSQ